MTIKEPTPAEMLTWYRHESPPFINEQAALFMELHPAEQIELMFYMHAHHTMALQWLHGKIDPDTAGTRGMPTPMKAN